MVWYSLRATLDKTGRDLDFFLNGIQQFGKLYDMDGSDLIDLLEFQQIVNELDKSFDITTELKAVSKLICFQ